MPGSRIKIGKGNHPGLHLESRRKAEQWSPGAAARWWLHHALASLGKDIEDLGGSLILQKGKAEEILPRLS